MDASGAAEVSMTGFCPSLDSPEQPTKKAARAKDATIRRAWDFMGDSPGPGTRGRPPAAERRSFGNRWAFMSGRDFPAPIRGRRR
jgi:hypothetical protein